MKLLNLKLRGSIGVFKGLGLNEIEIDFTKFQPGLIAITGKNGSSKTTILENCHAYRCMVSRDGSLQSHFFLKDSHRILKFEQDGKIYEAKILIDALTAASEAYLICNGVPLNDGKLNSYDTEIEKVLGSQELFFNSVFSGQKSKGISELKPADRRKLFYELLNLNSYETYLEEAKARLKTNENKLAEIEGEIKALQQDQTSIDILEEQRKEKLEYQAQLIGEISDIESSIEGANEVIRETEVKLELANQKVLANGQIQKELNEIEKQILSITELNNGKVVRYQGDIEDQKKLIDRYRKLATPEAKEKVEQALADKKEHQAKLDELKTVASNLDKDYADFQREYSVMLKALGEFEKSYNAREKEYDQLSTQIDDLTIKVTRATKDAEIIDKVPCDSETGVNCQFLLNAYASRTLIPETEKVRDELSDKKKIAFDELQTLKNKLHDKKFETEEFFNQRNASSQDSIKANNAAMKTIEQSLTSLNHHNYEKLLEEQKEAENQIKLCEQSISGHEKLIAETKLSFDNAIAQLKKQAEDLNHRYDATVNDRIEEMKLDLVAAKQKLIGLNQQLQSSRARMDEANSEVAKFEQLIETMRRNEERIEKLKCSKVEVESEIKDWTFLTKAFDKTGIPVLKLENSGIEITSVANDLLSIFENKFRIVFETTKLKADKKSYKESFDINIVEEDGVCEISNKSGGERVWIETALQLAISLVVRQQGKKIETSFLDEKDGQLDSNNANLYLAMLRNAHNKSGIHNTFIITHRNELIDLIPQRVSLSDGYIKIEVN